MCDGWVTDPLRWIIVTVAADSSAESSLEWPWRFFLLVVVLSTDRAAGAEARCGMPGAGPSMFSRSASSSTTSCGSPSLASAPAPATVVSCPCSLVTTTATAPESALPVLTALLAVVRRSKGVPVKSGETPADETRWVLKPGSELSKLELVLVAAEGYENAVPPVVLPVLARETPESGRSARGVRLSCASACSFSSIGVLDDFALASGTALGVSPDKSTGLYTQATHGHARRQGGCPAAGSSP